MARATCDRQGSRKGINSMLLPYGHWLLVGHPLLIITYITVTVCSQMFFSSFMKIRTFITFFEVFQPHVQFSVEDTVHCTLCGVGFDYTLSSSPCSLLHPNKKKNATFF